MGGLVGVSIRTTDEGPYLEDVFFVLANRDGTGCVVPQALDPEGRLIKRLQELPGFDNRKVIEAMSCCENRTFVCWWKPAAGGPT